MKKLFLSIIALFAVAALWSRSPLVTEKPTTVFQDTLTMLNVVVCQEDLPYAFNNQLLTDPGTYWDSLTTVNGFDSIVQLNLLVKCCQAATNSPNFADVCGEAPLLCKAYMEATPFDLNNSTADIPGNVAAQFCYPVDHSRWLRFSACASTVSLELSVQNCSGTDPLQNGVEIALFTSPDCLNFTRLGSCYQTAVLDTQILQFDGLIPGNEYYLLADGIGANICSFRLKALSGVNSGMPDSYNTVGAEADGAIVGDNDVCAGETATYTIIPPSCKLTFPVFSCSPPEGACGFCGTVLTLDSIIYKWHIPECARFLGDSTGLDVTIIYDQCIFDTDTVVTQTIWAEVIPIYSDTSFVQKDTLIFCDCFGGGLSCGNIPPLDIKIHYNVEHIFLIIPCVGPPPEFMGTIYPAPGLFIKFDALNCILYKIHVEKELDPSISISFGGTITCVYFPTLQAISADPITWQTPFGSMGNSPTIVAYEPGVYTAVATSAGGCISAASTVVNLDVQPPFTYLGPDLFVCSEELPVQLTAIGSWGFNLYNWSTGATGQSITDFQSGGIFTYAVTITNPQNGCTDSDNITVTYNSPLYTSLSPVVLCPGECFMLGGETFCPVVGDPPAQVTLTSYTGCDSIVTRPFIFQSPPPTMLSPIGLCPGECFTFNGQMICPSAGDTPPSMLLSTANGCDSMVVQPFVFNAPDTTQLGLMATLTCAVTTAVINGTTYSQPGVYAVQVDPCTVEKFIIAQNIQSPPPTILSPIGLCPGECFTFNGQMICPSQGDVPPNMFLSAANGCDSMVIQPFVFNAPDTTQLGVMATLTCAVTSAVINGITYSQPGVYAVQIDPCTVDQFSIAQNIQLPPPTMLSPIGLCPGECFTFNGQMICPSQGDAPPNMLLSAANGCDSMVIQPFVLNAPDTTQLGVMATLTCAVTSAVINGTTYSQPGVYAVQVDPCTVEQFSIAQNIQSPPPTMLSPIGLCPGECFTFNGQMVCPSSGDTPPGMLLPATNGCDSMVIQPFVFNAPDTTQLGVMATLTCAVTLAVVNGTTYSQPGVYTVQIDPCTVEQFSIAQNIQSPPPTMLSPIGLCPGECFTFNGQMVCPSSGDTPPGMLLPATNGCDSMVIQPFVFNAPDTTQLGVMATLTCAVTSAVINGTTYSQPGVYAVQVDPCTVEQFSIEQTTAPALTMLPIVHICPGDCIEFDGLSFCPQPGDPPLQKLLQTTGGCDSLIQQPFALNVPDTLLMGTLAMLSCVDTSVVLAGITYTQAGEYVKQKDPCTYERFTIAENPEKCLNVYVPNIIQADSENANSWFTLYTNVDSGIEINYLRIFDRWGNQVFLSTHFPPNAPQSGWNGLFNGKPCLPGVYVFMYELQLPDGVRQVKTGDLTLIR